VRLAIAGGGTGGHIVPGLYVLAFGREPRAGDAGESPTHDRAHAVLRPVGDVVWFTSGRSVEVRVMASDAARHVVAGVERIALPLEPRGGGAPSRASLAWRTPRAVVCARAALARHRSQVLLGLGGFTTLPAVLAARSLGIPVALLEVNAHEGAATRWLERFATRVLHAWPSTLPARDAHQQSSAGRGTTSRDVHRWTGPPLPPSVCARPTAADEARARAELGFDPARPLLVVLGGSQGAAGLNAFVRAHAPALVARGVQILHQTGPGKLGESAPSFTGYRALEYVDPVERALHAATVVLCRGGASTLAEIAALRKPAVVVPYPHHADRHQEQNARQLGDGVRIVDESRLGVAARDEIAVLCSAAGESERARMSAALRSAMPIDGSRRVYEELCALAAGAACAAETAAARAEVHR
jgi:UDP-N-acetylglucosamine--N-acetylmuramyl-(pentapeptide) pyrophosphoryl-undecaprenol N-acetylglucosamine transferase